MVILLSFFKLYDFVPVILKRRKTLPLFCEVPLTVLTFGQKDKFTHTFLLLFYFDICVFTPVFKLTV